MLLTPAYRLKLCFEVLTLGAGRLQTPQEKELSTFQRGYEAGRRDASLEHIEMLEERLRQTPDHSHGK